MAYCSVLIVDDDRDVRETLREVLELEGYHVESVSNGEEAMKALRDEHHDHQDRPCLILLDLMMPVMSGWEFLDVRRNDEKLKNIPVVVVTASGRQVDQNVTAGTLRKPIDLQKLLRIVESFCGHLKIKSKDEGGSAAA